MTAHLLRVGLLLAGSGFCALIYQIVWMRELRLVFGASTAATAAVTAVFMAGLGAGSALLGKVADSRSRPLRLYAGLELLIACLAMVSPVLIVVARALYTSAGGTMAMGLFGGTAARLLLSTVILGGATFAMGGTLPAAVRTLESAKDADRRYTAFLYGMNTIGAVVGALCATFVMLEMFGLRNTLYIAALANVLIALTARHIARGLPVSASAETRPAVIDAATAEEVSVSTGCAVAASPDPRFVYLTAFFTGFVFFLMELVWYRMLSPILGGTTYSYGLILAVALLGIGSGGGLYALMGGAVRGGLMMLAITCFLEAVLMAIPYFMGDWIAVAAALMLPFKTLGLTGQVFSWSVVTMAVVFPAAVVAGYQFPLLIALLGRGSAGIGRHTGNAYAFNTAGAITGALTGGFGLMTALSAPGCWRLSIMILLALSVAAAFLSSRRHGFPRALAMSVSSIIVVSLGAVFAGPSAAWRHSPIGAGRLSMADKSLNEIRDLMSGTRRGIIWEMDGKESAIGLDQFNGYAFIVNGKSDGHAINDAATQVMGGLIGAVIHPNPKRSLVIGLGTGSTAGWLASVPTMDRVDVVEIEPGIRHVAKACTPVNQDVLNNPKCRIIYADAREVFMTTDQTYDLIFSEPSNPYRAGIANLYTVEFFTETAKRLAPGGIFMQWVQAYEIAPRTLKSIYVTLSEVFPNIETWETATNDIVLLCSREPLRMDRNALAQKLAEEPFRSALINTWHVVGLEGYLSRYVANRNFARRFSKTEHPHWWLNTDDRPQIEFDFARTVGLRQQSPLGELKALAKAAHQDRPDIDAASVDWERVRGDALVWQLVRANNNNLEEDPPQGQKARLEAYGLLMQKQWKLLHRIVTSGRFNPQTPDDRIVSAIALAMAGDAGALSEIEILKQDRPVDAEALSAIYYWALADTENTRVHLEKTLRMLQVDPWARLHAVLPALDLAVPVARGQKAAIRPLTQLLAHPFSVGMLSEHRLRLRLRVASLEGYAQGAEALAPFEPDVPWELEFLRYRRDTYRAARHPLLAAAERDLRLFQMEAPKPVASFIEPSGQEASAGRQGEGDERL